MREPRPRLLEIVDIGAPALPFHSQARARWCSKCCTASIAAPYRCSTVSRSVASCGSPSGLIRAVLCLLECHSVLSHVVYRVHLVYKNLARRSLSNGPLTRAAASRSASSGSTGTTFNGVDLPDARPHAQYHVELLLPRGRELPELVRTMHGFDRTLGIIEGAAPVGTRLVVLTRDSSPDAARERALAVLRKAAKAHEQSHVVADVTVGAITLYQPLAGSGRQVGVPAGDDHQELCVGGRTIAAVREPHPLGEWIVWLVGEEPAWRGRDLGGLARELFQSPHGARDPRVEELRTQLLGHATPDGIRFPCACCEYLTLDEAPPGTHAICGVCRWQDDGVQFVDPKYDGGANSPSLVEARETFRRIGVSEKRLQPYARPPKPHEIPPG